MSSDNNTPDNNPDQNVPDNKPNEGQDSELIAKLVKERLESELKPIKEKLDSAFSARDEALRKIAEFEQKEKDENLKRLQEEGKHKEAYDLQLAEERAKKEVLEKKVTELTRDVTVRDVLKSYSFRNDNAADMAYREIVSQLVQNEQGVWVHRSGVSIREFTESFAKSEEQSFLFKVKGNNGSGGGNPNQNNDSSNDQPKSLFAMSQAEVLKMATEGKLPNRK
jgi:hypothetical protein